MFSNQIDYTQVEPPALQNLEKDGIYPPRYVISISGNNATESDTLKVNFKGSQDPLSAEVMLELQLPRHAPHTPPVSLSFYYMQIVM